MTAKNPVVDVETWWIDQPVEEKWKLKYRFLEASRRAIEDWWDGLNESDKEAVRDNGRLSEEAS